MKNELLTTTLRDGTEVLAKNHKDYGITAYTYCNRTQAIKRLELLREQDIGIDASVYQPRLGPVFFIRIHKTYLVERSDHNPKIFNIISNGEIVGVVEKMSSRCWTAYDYDRPGIEIPSLTFTKDEAVRAYFTNCT